MPSNTFPVTVLQNSVKVMYAYGWNNVKWLVSEYSSSASKDIRARTEACGGLRGQDGEVKSVSFHL